MHLMLYPQRAYAQPAKTRLDLVELCNSVFKSARPRSALAQQSSRTLGSLLSIFLSVSRESPVSRMNCATENPRRLTSLVENLAIARFCTISNDFARGIMEVGDV